MKNAQAVLLGLVVGDALAAPLDGMKPGHIRQLFGEVVDYVDPMEAMPDRPGKWRLSGLYGAPAQQAFALVEVLALYGEADATAFAELLERLAKEGPRDAPCGAHRGVDHHFRRTIDRLEEVEDPRRAAQPNSDNAAAARIAPAGVWFAGDADALRRAVFDASLVTHGDPRAISAAAAVARAVELLGAGAEPDEVAQNLAAWTREAEEALGDERGEFLDPAAGRDRLHMFSKALQLLPALLRETDRPLIERSVVAVASECAPPEGGRIAQPAAAFAPASALWALRLALGAQGFANGLIEAVNAGGGSSVGAMTGALLGARFGSEAIPPEWLRGLVNRDQALLRARALAERAIDWASWEDLIEMERGLTEREREAAAGEFEANRREIEKRKARDAAKRERAAKAAARSRVEEDDFAPPPDLWLGAARGRRHDPLEISDDPVQAQKDRSRRGRKRIDWKEERRRQAREGGKDAPHAETPDEED